MFNRTATPQPGLILGLCLIALPCLAQENNIAPEGFLRIFNGQDLKGWGGGEDAGADEVGAGGCACAVELEEDGQGRGGLALGLLSLGLLGFVRRRR